jgi:hypothetical protein
VEAVSHRRLRLAGWIFMALIFPSAVTEAYIFYTGWHFANVCEELYGLMTLPWILNGFPFTVDPNNL